MATAPAANDPEAPAVAPARPAAARSALGDSQGILLLSLGAIGYWIAAHLGLIFIPAAGGVTPVWPPNGFALGLLLAVPTRRWPWVMAGVLFACAGANLTAGRGLPVTLGFSAANAIEILAGAAVFRRLHGRIATFTTRREAGLLGLVAVPVFACTAVIGAFVAVLLLGGDLYREWQTWWLGDAVGTLLITPAVALAAHAVRHWQAPALGAVLEAALYLGMHAFLCFITFLVAPALESESLLSATIYPYLTLITLLFAAQRLGPAGSAAACLIATGFALLSHLPLVSAGFIGGGDVRTILSTQVFLAASALLGLYVAAQREQQRAARRALMESEARFRQLTEAAPVGIFIARPAEGVTYLNAAAARITGRPAAALFGARGFEAIHPGDRRRVVAQWQAAVEAEADFREEYRFIQPNGQIHWCMAHARAVRDDGGAYACHVGTMTDITSVKSAELRLRESEARFRDLAEASPALIWLTDREGALEYVNSAWRRFFGRALERDLGLPLTSIVHPADQGGPAEAWWVELRGGRPFAAECRVIRHDGAPRNLLVQGAPRHDEHGVLIGFSGTCLDVTPMREAEEARIAMNNQLQAASNAENIRILAGGVAHEFNNILTSVLGNANLAQLESGLADTVRDKLSRIEEGALRAADLTRKLLAFSGRSASLKDLHALSRVIEDTLPLLRTSMPRHVQLHVQLARELPAAHLDATQVQHLLTYLFTNAVEAVGESPGNIHVSTAARECTDTSLAALGAPEHLPGSYVYIRVEDDGPGIAPEVLDRMFKPFFSTKFLGRGLGLPAVQGIVREHGGFLHVASTPGKGAAFTAYFPAVPARAQTAQRATPALR